MLKIIQSKRICKYLQHLNIFRHAKIRSNILVQNQIVPILTGTQKTTIFNLIESTASVRAALNLRSLTSPLVIPYLA